LLLCCFEILVELWGILSFILFLSHSQIKLLVKKQLIFYWMHTFCYKFKTKEYKITYRSCQSYPITHYNPNNEQIFFRNRVHILLDNNNFLAIFSWNQWIYNNENVFVSNPLQNNMRSKICQLIIIIIITKLFLTYKRLKKMNI
jgi:hypothetical protein